MPIDDVRREVERVRLERTYRNALIDMIIIGNASNADLSVLAETNAIMLRTRAALSESKRREETKDAER